MKTVKCPKCENITPEMEPVCVFCQTPIEGNVMGKKMRAIVEAGLNEKVAEIKADINKSGRIIAGTASAAVAVIAFFGYTKWEDLRKIPESAIRAAVDEKLKSERIAEQCEALIKEARRSEQQFSEERAKIFKDFGGAQERLNQATKDFEEMRNNGKRAHEDTLASLKAVGLLTDKLRTDISKLTEAFQEDMARSTDDLKKLSQKLTDEGATALTVIATKTTEFEKTQESANKRIADYERAFERLEPRLKEMASFLSAEDAAAIFAKLQSDFTSIKSFQARIQYFFGKDEIDRVPLGHPALGRDQLRIAEMRGLNDSLTTIILANGENTYVQKFELFEMFAMQLEGQAIAALDQINQATLSFSASPREIRKFNEDANEPEAYKKFRDRKMSALKRLKKIELTTLINGYPVSRCEWQAQDIYVQPEEKLPEEGDRIMVRFDVAKCFADTKATLSAAVMKAHQSTQAK